MAFRDRLLRYLAMTLGVSLVLALTACGVPMLEADEATSQDEAVTTGKAPVESIQLMILESLPLQVRVRVRGTLPDVCTEIDQINQRVDLEQDTLWVEITTVRSTEEACVQVLAPFEETIPLDVMGLPAGTYTVDVNGVTDTFTFSTDNVPLKLDTDE